LAIRKKSSCFLLLGVVEYTILIIYESREIARVFGEVAQFFKDLYPIDKNTFL